MINDKVECDATLRFIALRKGSTKASIVAAITSIQIIRVLALILSGSVGGGGIFAFIDVISFYNLIT
jgi:hypothetical protein